MHAGEILGIAGVDGNGQSELAEALMHLRQVRSGEVWLSKGRLTGMSVAARRDAGLAYIPADRRHVGSVTEMSVAENVMLDASGNKNIFRNRRRETFAAHSLVKRFDLRASSVDTPAGKLSGGNLQKLILGREILHDSHALIVEQPTRGLDVGSIESIWGELLRARSAGKAILLISAELEELLNLADRIAVIYEGRIVGIVDLRQGTVEIAALRTQLGLMMTGSAEEANAQS